MKTFPLPALVAAAAAIGALPFSIIGAGTLLLTAGFGFIIHADYALRDRRIRLPRRARSDDAGFSGISLRREERRLAA